MEQVIKPKSPGSFIRIISGLFISKEHQHGLSPKECSILAALLTLVTSEDEVITKTIKIDLANLLNQSLQVATNYMNKFKQKGIVLQNNKLHPILFKNKIIIEYGSSEEREAKATIA